MSNAKKIVDHLIEKSLTEMGESYRFKNLSGGVGDIFMSRASYGGKGTGSRISVFSSSEGGNFVNPDMIYKYDEPPELVKLEIAAEIRAEAGKFDAAVGAIMSKRGFKLS